MTVAPLGTSSTTPSVPRAEGATSRRGFIRLVALGVAGMGAVACDVPGSGPASRPAEAPAGREVKLGANFPMTGRWTDFSRKNRIALELAVEEINAQGGINGAPVRVILVDNASQPPEAANLVRKLATTDEVLAILGPFSSSEAEAAFPVANALKVPTISPASSKPGISGANRPWTFRNNVDEVRLAAVTVRRWVELYGIRTAAVVHDLRDAASQSLGADVLPAAARQYGVTIVNEGQFITFATNNLDYTAQVAELGALKADGIIFGGVHTDGATFLIEARRQGLRQMMVGGNPLFNDSFLKNGGPAVDGTIVPTTFYSGLPEPKVQEFVGRFKERARAANLPITDPDFSDVHVYDDLHLLADIISREGVTNRPQNLEQDRERIRQALGATRNWPGLAGTVGFNEDGDGLRPVYVVKADGGRWVGV
jgi:branched-chain amino acid transport system substrate-binding protein